MQIRLAMVDCHFPLWMSPKEFLGGHRHRHGHHNHRRRQHFYFHNLRIWVTVLIVCNYYSIYEAWLSCRVESANLIKFKYQNELYPVALVALQDIQRFIEPHRQRQLAQFLFKGSLRRIIVLSLPCHLLLSHYTIGRGLRLTHFARSSHNYNGKAHKHHNFPQSRPLWGVTLKRKEDTPKKSHVYYGPQQLGVIFNGTEIVAIKSVVNIITTTKRNT